jgi:hypothetical protein
MPLPPEITLAAFAAFVGKRSHHPTPLPDLRARLPSLLGPSKKEEQL